MKSKNVLQSLTAAGKAAAAESRSVASTKLRAAAAPLSSPSGGKTGAATAAEPPAAAPQRKRVALYLAHGDFQKLLDMRNVVSPTGLRVSDNALIVATLRALDLKQRDRFIEHYKAVLAEDGRQKD